METPGCVSEFGCSGDIGFEVLVDLGQRQPKRCATRNELFCGIGGLKMNPTSHSFAEALSQAPRAGHVCCPSSGGMLVGVGVMAKMS
jgi:hypothetical protein